MCVCGGGVLLVMAVAVWPDGAEEWRDKENGGEAYILHLEWEE